jgi:hypothetical protein
LTNAEICENDNGEKIIWDIEYYCSSTKTYIDDLTTITFSKFTIEDLEGTTNIIAHWVDEDGNKQIQALTNKNDNENLINSLSIGYLPRLDSKNIL